MAGGVVAVEGGGRSALYKGRTTFAVVMIGIIAGCGGLLFGYDNGITGGVIAQRNFQEIFFPEQLQKHAGAGYCSYNDQILQVFTSSLFLAAAFTALVGMWSCKKYGRRVTMLMGGLAFCIGELATSKTPSPKWHLGAMTSGYSMTGQYVLAQARDDPTYCRQ
eukprot:GHUV01044482.1.p1 GENE.GHUV01044482.1~~GHUV01044482.1.p1  ORF type:complete len:163 (+),score=26.54 GHUV01044482.1:690-1178(+)